MDQAFFKARLRRFLHIAFVDETGRVQFTFEKKQSISNPFEVSRKNEREGSSLNPSPSPLFGGEGKDARHKKPPFYLGLFYIPGGGAVQFDFHFLVQVLVVLLKNFCHFGSREFHGQLAALRQRLPDHGP
jgi:hypothetical protein